MRGRWDVTDWLAFRSTYGTAYRSPGLVELFQNPNVTLAKIGDVCIVPPDAIRTDGSYDPSGDFRPPLNLERCRNQGVDPTTFGAGILDVPTTTLLQGGSKNGLKPETSTSLTAGFTAQIPLTKIFGPELERTRVNLSATYYELDVRKVITIGDLGTVYAQCFGDPNSADVCDRITRGPDGYITQVNVDFVNRDGRRTRGLDFNLVWNQ